MYTTQLRFDLLSGYGHEVERCLQRLHQHLSSQSGFQRIMLLRDDTVGAYQVLSTWTTKAEAEQANGIIGRQLQDDLGHCQDSDASGGSLPRSGPVWETYDPSQGPPHGSSSRGLGSV